MSSGTHRGTPQNATAGKILVVDDEVELTTALCEILKRQGYQVTGITRGMDALPLLGENSHDILLVDLMMPEIDGISLLRKALELDPHLSGIIMTGQGTVQTAVEAMKSGALDYVLKPFKVNALLPVLSRALQIRRLRMENVQLRELLNIYELGRVVTSTLDTKTIFHKTAEVALQECQADEVSILIPEEDENILVVASAHGEGRDHLIGLRVPVEGTVAGWVARNQETLTIQGVVKDPRFNATNPRPEILSAVSMPMVLGSKLIGVINVNLLRHKHALTEGQIKGLKVLLSIAASAIENARLYSALSQSNEQLSCAYHATIEGWSRAMDLRDHETEGHTQRVTDMTLRLAKEFGGFDEQDLIYIRWGALLHDIGKMGVSDAILLKQGPLTEDEWAVMYKHPEYACQLLSPIDYLQKALDIPSSHHERWDGSGYPRGLKERQIPLAARIFAVVDVWDALRSDRPYRPGWPNDQVIEYLREKAGTLFDPEVVMCFLEVLKK